MSPKDTTQPTPYETPDFSTFITELADGTINQHLTEALAEVCRGAEETRKIGELTIKLQVKMEGTMAVVAVDVKKKVPEHPLRGTLFFFGDNGELLREDPRQLRMRSLEEPNLRTVNFPTKD